MEKDFAHSNPGSDTTNEMEIETKPKRQSLSGAQRRKLKRAREAMALAELGYGPGSLTLPGTSWGTPAAPEADVRTREVFGTRPWFQTDSTSWSTLEEPGSSSRSLEERSYAEKRTWCEESTPQLHKRRREAGSSYQASHHEASYHEPNDYIPNHHGPNVFPPAEVIQVAVIPEGFPEITINPEQANLIKAAVLSSMDYIGEGGPSPRFAELRHAGGFLKVVCNDEATWHWLTQVIEHCAPWQGAQLHVVDFNSMPRPIKVKTWIPGPPEEPETILKRLKVQNAGLRTDNWKVVDRRCDPKGQLLIIVMGEGSWREVQQVECRPFLNFSRVLFKVLGQRREETAVRPAFEPPTMEQAFHPARDDDHDRMDPFGKRRPPAVP